MMNIFEMMDPITYELDAKRRAGETEEAKHDCRGCRERVGIPCLKAYRCERWKDESKRNQSRIFSPGIQTGAD